MNTSRDNEWRNAFKSYKPDFEPYFETRLLGQLERELSSLGITWAFQRIAFSGLVAVSLLLVVIYITQGNLQIETLLGLQDLTPEEASSFVYNTIN